jgi:hypothetical protein
MEVANALYSEALDKGTRIESLIRDLFAASRQGETFHKDRLQIPRTRKVFLFADETKRPTWFLLLFNLTLL